MRAPSLNLTLVEYEHLNSRQKENYNFQKVSGVLADYGFVTLRLSDDWQGADFIANHISGQQFIKVQLKGRLTLDQKYQGKDIWICFRHQEIWYLFPHDAALAWALKYMSLGKPAVWENGTGVWSYRSPPKQFLEWLRPFALTHHSTGSVQKNVQAG
jgi:hypothetical protein